MNDMGELRTLTATKCSQAPSGVATLMMSLCFVYGFRKSSKIKKVQKDGA
jgi:hypothetical protein